MQYEIAQEYVSRHIEHISNCSLTKDQILEEGKNRQMLRLLISLSNQNLTKTVTS